MTERTKCLQATLAFTACWIVANVLAVGVSAAESAGSPAVGTQTLDFPLFWPPRLPPPAIAEKMRPLLSGRLTVRTEKRPDTGARAHLRISLHRPSDESARLFWNSRLAFLEYDWMKYVRVWDTETNWIWPNLPYLLRLHGRERAERYGGVDPGKGVDNDFAAVLIRKYDRTGETEIEETRRSPLVSAEWSPESSRAAGKDQVIHTALSDEFHLHLGDAAETTEGIVSVWLIYADFMGALVPPTWPKQPEFAGGILAYFELRWKLPSQNAPLELVVQQLIPKRSTGFDWDSWAARTRSVADSRSTAKLSD